MSAPARSARSVLVVDDLDDAADSLAAVLELYGFSARAVATGAAALASVVDDPPDAVVLDLLMPDLDGWELARRVRAATTKTPLLIALTGYPADEARRRATEAGIDLYLLKPIEPAVLVSALNRDSTPGECSGL
jgi:CheY-like chemotaxis protein